MSVNKSYLCPKRMHAYHFPGEPNERGQSRCVFCGQFMKKRRLSKRIRFAHTANVPASDTKTLAIYALIAYLLTLVIYILWRSF